MKAIFTSITLLLFWALGSQSYGGNPDVKKPEIKITTPTEKQQESANIQKQRIPDGDYTGLRQMGFMCIHCWTSAATCFTVIDGWAIDPFGLGVDYHISGNGIPVVSDKTPGVDYEYDNTRPTE